ncbi:TonB-dependent receptor [Sphingosinicella soli]|uniref:Iron complex outermembrane receptor protein n=1 Tax=Sphingosinicella soli TaxID=333708 RepID=A0A7W7B3B5_9SPHN|nr:TonB-dependent receptor [Sphingosinicella soli]MBB4633249.1 iron complex outermembrane receptor protein [Sphingosinicella soli]
MNMSRCTILAGIAASALMADLAQAQTTPAAGAPVVVFTDEILVTARRREESLLDVASSVAVISADTITASGSATFSDLGFSAANVVFNNSVNVSGFRGVSIRGIQGRTGIYVDDILLGNEASANVAVNDVERVEILRGPQGTTFGRNTLAGAVNTITRRPSFDWTGSAKGAYGNYGRRGLDAYVSGPLVDDVLAFKASAVRLKTDGYEVDADGNDVMTQDLWAARGTFLFTPAENLRFLVGGDYQYDDPIVNAYHLVTGPGTTYVENTIATSFQNKNSRENYGAFFRGEFEASDALKLVSITALRKTRSDFYLDYDFLSADIFYEKGPRNVDEFSHEFRASGDVGIVSWLAGIYYYDSKYIDRNSSFLGVDYGGPATGGLTLGQLGLPGAISTQYLRRDNSSLAGYGSVDIRVTPQLKVVLGARYSHDTVREETFTGNLTSRFVIGAVTPQVHPIVAYPKITSNRFTPSGSISYEPNDDMNLYATIGTGYQTGGFNASACNGSTTLASCEYKPETLTSYEIGYKARLFDRKLQFNLAAFYLDYRNLQRNQRFFYQVDGSTVQIDTTTNAARASGRGVELEFQARPMEALSFDGSVGYQDSHYNSYPNAPVRVALSGAPQLRDLSGDALPYAPKWTGSVAANVTGNHALGEFRLRAELQYRDPYKTADGPFYIYQIKSQTNLNLSAETEIAKGVSIAVRARNVLNKQYIINQSYDASFTGQFYVARSEPRYVWAEVRFDF